MRGYSGEDAVALRAWSSAASGGRRESGEAGPSAQRRSRAVGAGAALRETAAIFRTLVRY